MRVLGTKHGLRELESFAWSVTVLGALACVACAPESPSQGGIVIAGSGASRPSVGAVAGANAGVPAAVTQPSAGRPGSDAAGTPAAVSIGAAGAGAGAAGAAGAAGTAAMPTGPATSVDFCQVEPIFKAACQACHAAAPLYGAPMPLVTHDDLVAPSKSNAALPVYKLIATRIHDTQRPMPPTTATTQLTAAQLAQLDTYLAAGAPPAPAAGCTQSTGTTQPSGSDTTAIPGRALTDDDAAWPDDCGEHYKFLASGTSGKKYSVGAGRQFYANINIPAPWGNKSVQALRFRAVIDNKKVIHHYILYGPDQSFIDGWAPGQGGITMPPTVGMQLPNGTYRLEVHYNNQQGTAAELDDSGLEVCVAKTPRPNVAAVHELGSMLINVGAHQTSNLVSKCAPRISGGEVHLMEVNPHMHRLGVHAKLVLKRASGEEVIVHDAPFSFDDQRKYILPEDASAADIVMKKGDTLTSTCSFDNTTNLPVTFGQNTENEMCFFYVIAWPMGQLVNGSMGPEGDPNACL